MANNLAYSPAFLIVRVSYGNLNSKKAVFRSMNPAQSASGRYFTPLLNGDMSDQAIERLSRPEVVAALPDKIVLIVVESLSVLHSDTNLTRLLAPLRPLESHYQIETGTLDWFSSTLRGQMRELCWRDLDGLNLVDLPPSLPSVLKKAGYETTMFHGFFSTMYNRHKTFPRLGFDRLTFLEQMQQTNTVPIAGTLFRGAEDGFVAHLVHQELRQPKRQFVHWMTLSGHVPIDVDYAKKISADPRPDPAMPDAVWAHAEICEKVFRSIAEIAADPAIGRCDFIIVGDHPLPLSNPLVRAWYQEQTVPYVLLRQREKSVVAP